MGAYPLDKVYLLEDLLDKAYPLDKVYLLEDLLDKACLLEDLLDRVCPQDKASLQEDLLEKQTLCSRKDKGYPREDLQDKVPQLPRVQAQLAAVELHLCEGSCS